MLEFSRYHFVGVAGVGMSSVAQAVCHQGCTVTGSDRYRDKGNCQPVIQQLEKAGIKLYQQDGSGVIAGADALVVSTAIEADNPDVVEAKAQGLPVRHRSEVLAQLVDGHTCVAIAGTSGKSTVTGMVGWVLEQTGFDPTVVNGAPVINWSDDNSIGNMRRGNSSLWVIEADESDRSLLNYNPSCAVITNISADHFDLDETRLLFKQFAEKVNGPVLGALSDADYVEGVEPVITSHSSAFDFDGVRFELALPGRHNVENALHAASLCEHMGVALADSAEALRSFKAFDVGLRWLVAPMG
jgi:UDP-N-acetylmuramate--alanine ligase